LGSKPKLHQSPSSNGWQSHTATSMIPPGLSDMWFSMASRTTEKKTLALKTLNCMLKIIQPFSAEF